MYEVALVINQELEVVNKTEQETAHLRMQVAALLFNEARTRHTREYLFQPCECLLWR